MLALLSRCTDFTSLQCNLKRIMRGGSTTGHKWKRQINPSRCFLWSVSCWDTRELCFSWKLELMTRRTHFSFFKCLHWRKAREATRTCFLSNFIASSSKTKCANAAAWKVWIYCSPFCLSSVPWFVNQLLMAPSPEIITLWQAQVCFLLFEQNKEKPKVWPHCSTRLRMPSGTVINPARGVRQMSGDIRTGYDNTCCVETLF